MSHLISIARPGLRLGDRPERNSTARSSVAEATLESWLVKLRRNPVHMAGFKALLQDIESIQKRMNLPATGDQSVAWSTITLEIRQRLLSHGHTAALPQAAVVQAFAAIRLAARELLGLYPHPEQLFAAWAMLHGVIVEMHTGEGKTLTAAFPAIVMAMTGTPVHVITVNEYLVQRDAEKLKALYTHFDLSVGVVTDAMNDDERRKAYACDIVYATNKQVVFDYLRDNQVLQADRSGLTYKLRSLLSLKAPMPIMRGLGFAIVDEADSVLIDDARVPLILAQPQQTERTAVAEAVVALSIARSLHEGADFRLQPEQRSVWLTTTGLDAIRAIGDKLEGAWRFERYRNELVRQALSALHIFRQDRNYIVHDGQVVLIDESTGRVMPDRKLQHGLHRMLEVKENCEVTDANEVIAGLSFQRFFQRYCSLSGMSGTLTEVNSELRQVYGVGVTPVPAHVPGQRSVLATRVFTNRSEQFDYALADVAARHLSGQPVLVGTRSVELSEQLSYQLAERGIEHTLLNARQDAAEAEIVAAGGKPFAVTVATNMAGRGTDISLQGKSASLGGLHVINLEVNESRRVDRQLFGRCARQGDPGSCQAILSLSDELVETMVSAAVRSAVALLMKRWPDAGQVSARQLVRTVQHRIEQQHEKQRLAVFRGQEQLKRHLAISGDLE